MSTKAQQYGLLSFLSAMAGSQGVHWFITPHADASLLQTWAVAAQVFVGFAFAAFAYRRSRQAQASAQPASEAAQHSPDA